MSFTGFSLHLSRIILNTKLLKSIRIKHQILGLFGSISLFNNKTYIIGPIIRNYILHKHHKINGFNIIIDPIITTLLILSKLFKIYLTNLTNLERNYLDSDIIYHLLEIYFYIDKIRKK